MVDVVPAAGWRVRSAVTGESSLSGVGGVGGSKAAPADSLGIPCAEKVNQLTRYCPDRSNCANLGVVGDEVGESVQ